MKQIIVDINGTPHEFDSTADDRPLNAREVVAQKVLSQHQISHARHKVMVSPDGDLFNPSDGVSLQKKVARYGINKYFFNLRRCSEGCYNDYVAFLRSKNKTNLILAQRRFYDES